MLDELRGELDEHVTPLLRDILEDTQKLLRQEFALAKVEVREDAKRLREVFGYSIAAAIATALSAGLLAVSAALLLVAWFPWLQPWAAFAALAFVCALSSVVLLQLVAKKSRSIRVFPDQVLESLREDAQWIRGQTFT